MIESPRYLVIDLFCGAGGTTTGFEQTDGLAKVIACINHDKNAIKSHWLNHPDVTHFEEDIRTLNLVPLVALIKKWKKRYPNAKVILWASLECTNFSKAKGGLPRDADSRTLADCLKRYIKAIDPDIIQIENVVEFKSWGPLDKKGKPISKDKGRDWLRWCRQIKKFGYTDEWNELNSANFGAYTSRNRLFGMFSKKRDYITWPEVTHVKAKKGIVDQQVLNDMKLKHWKPVREVLDLEDEGNSIFNREFNMALRPQDRHNLSPNTIRRIYEGTVKHVIKEKPNFLINGNSSTAPSNDLENPAPTVTTGRQHNVVFISKYYSGNHKYMNKDIESPADALRTHDAMAVVNASFLTIYHSNGPQSYDLDRPATTLPTKDSLAKIHASYFMAMDYTNGYAMSIEQPSGTLVNNPKQKLVKVDHWLLNGNFNNGGKSLDEPAPTITADRHQHYIINPAWGGNSGDVDKPCCVIVARQDKAPLYLMACESGTVAIPVYEGDCEYTIKLKQLMVAYGLADIKMRMLKVPELKLIQGFPKDYQLFGSQADQKKFIGNSVVPLLPKVWIKAIDKKLSAA